MRADLECKTIQEQSCLAWQDDQNCSNCPPDKLLVNQNFDTGIRKICKDIASVLEFCVALESDTSNIQFNYKCGACQPEYYLKGGVCTVRPDNTDIQECKVYSESTEQSTQASEGGSTPKLICSMCNSGFVMSLDGSSCEAMPAGKFAEGCESGVRLKSPSCQFCGLGMILNAQGECESCGGSGCGVCSLLDTTKCRMCAPGYYMTEDLACAKNDQEYLFVDQDSVKTTNQSVGVVRWMFVCVLALLVLFGV